MFYLWQQRDKDFVDTVTKYKMAVFPQASKNAEANCPDWSLEIGGLSEPKRQITEMFGIT